MHKITRRPGKKKGTSKRIQANKRRQARAQKRTHQRKLKSKLMRLIDMVGYGYYTGVRESPLLRANFHFAMRVLSRRLQMPGV